MEVANLARCDSLRLPTYEELSKEQDAVLDLPLNGSCLVTGPPGSGKTVLAIYRAKALKDRSNERSVILMYNKLLSKYSGAAVRTLSVDSLVDNYHHWFPEWYRGVFNESAPRNGDGDFAWADILLRIVGRGSVPPAHTLHVVVDEGQDMPPAFFNVMSMISGQKGMLIFADENQAITNNQSSISEIMIAANILSPLTLSYNYRNTAQIAAVAAEFHTGIHTGVADLPPGYRTGDQPQFVRDESFDALVSRLLNLEATYQDRCIGVFYPKKWQVKSLYKRLDGRTRNPIGAYVSGYKKWDRREIEFDTPGINLTTFRSAKGLQFDIVLIPGLQLMDWPKPGTREFGMEMYVASTRAREQLIFSCEGAPGSPAVQSPAVQALPLSLMDVRL